MNFIWYIFKQQSRATENITFHPSTNWEEKITRLTYICWSCSFCNKEMIGRVKGDCAKFHWVLTEGLIYPWHNSSKVKGRVWLGDSECIFTIYGLQIHPNPCPSYLLWATHRQWVSVTLPRNSCLSSFKWVWEFICLFLQEVWWMQLQGQ